MPVVADDDATAAPHSISVLLVSGTTFTAAIDSQTDTNHLWLRWQRGGAVLLREIDWGQVASVRIAGKELSGVDFRKAVDAVRRGSPFQEEPPTGPRQLVIRRTHVASAEETAAAGPGAALREVPPIRSLAIEAEVARWDANVEADGLLVHVYPLDANGTIVPVTGTVEVDLTGERKTIPTPPQPFFAMGRWVQQIQPTDFGTRGAAYRLPFQGDHPEFDTSIHAYGAVHARLTVPGQGTFEATASTVRIRPYSAIRDELQQQTGHRFFPQERVVVRP